MTAKLTKGQALYTDLPINREREAGTPEPGSLDSHPGSADFLEA